MRWLTRAQHDENGAVIVLTMVVLFAIIAMAALVIDIGALQDEKVQLQNGADAGAVGVAQTCFPGPCNESLAGALVNGNARDHDSNYTVDSHTTAGFVTVRTSTKAGSSNLVPFQFGQILTGEKGKEVKATAVARWGGIRRTSVIPLTISKCEFDRATSNNTVFNVPIVVLFKTKAASCTASNGSDLPGGFGWVKDASPGDCSVTPSAGDIIPDDTGVRGTPNGCDLPSLLGKDVSLVVYNAVAGTGANGTYAIYGFGNFHLTGYRFASASGGTVPCASPDSCIAGYFVKSVGAVGTDQYGGPSLAGNLVTLVK
jgi:putative Flp pilus-assembly TadE/G-like protein